MKTTNCTIAQCTIQEALRYCPYDSTIDFTFC